MFTSSVQRARCPRVVVLFLVATLAMILSPALASANYGFVFWQGFDRGSHQAYPWWKLKQDFPSVKNWDNGVGGRYSGDNDSRVYLSGTKKAGSNSLKVSYPAYQFGPNNTGAQFEVPLGSSHDDLYLEYWVRFDSNFDWTPRWVNGRQLDYAGGKLPGVAGGPEGASISGGNKANGWNGFSTRLMFREWGKLAIYDYRENSSETWGDYYYAKYPNGHAKAGQLYYRPRNKWVKVKLRVKLNYKVGNNWPANGRAMLWVDDGSGEKLMVNQGGLRWRKTYNVKVDTFYFSTFYGGGDSNWAPDNTGTIWFDSFHAFTWN